MVSVIVHHDGDNFDDDVEGSIDNANKEEVTVCNTQQIYRTLLMVSCAIPLSFSTCISVLFLNSSAFNLISRRYSSIFSFKTLKE